jgi:hypothetical protein
MPLNDKKIWFRAKRYGWGWGLPCAWQGWVVFVGYIALIWAGAFLWGERTEIGYWIGYVVALTAVLIVVCAIKGEKPRWRWGGE